MPKRWLPARQAYQVDLVGPTAKDYRWQAREHNGYALTDFSIDWEHEQARCPQGQTSSSWTPTWTRNQEIIKIKFGFATCGGLSSPFSVYKGQATKPVRAATRSAFCFRGCSSARTDGRVQAGVCKASRRRRGPCPRSTSDGLAAIALHWRASHPSSACRHSDCHQYVPVA